MIAELLSTLHSDIAMGMAQAAGAVLLCAAVVLLCRRFAVHVARETAVSIARGLVQMVLVGMVLAMLAARKFADWAAYPAGHDLCCRDDRRTAGTGY